MGRCDTKSKPKRIVGDDVARFWSKVDQIGGSPEPGSLADLGGLGDCWRWLGPLTKGYGHFGVGGINISAHRYSYRLHGDPLLEGFQLDHLCRNRWCVNPDHLEQVTQRENILRSPTSAAAVNSRRTQCVNGHEFTVENTYLLPKGGPRACRICKVRAAKAQRLKSRG